MSWIECNKHVIRRERVLVLMSLAILALTFWLLPNLVADNTDFSVACVQPCHNSIPAEVEETRFSFKLYAFFRCSRDSAKFDRDSGTRKESRSPSRLLAMPSPGAGTRTRTTPSMILMVSSGTTDASIKPHASLTPATPRSVRSGFTTPLLA